MAESVWVDGVEITAPEVERWVRLLDGTWRSERTGQVVRATTVAAMLQRTGQDHRVAYTDTWCLIPTGDA